MRIIGNISLDDLSEVYVGSEIHLNCIHVSAESIAGDLYAVTKARGNIGHKNVGSCQIALPTLERRHQFRIGINRAEGPNVTHLRVIVWCAMPFFLADESPNLIELELLTGEVTHLAV